MTKENKVILITAVVVGLGLFVWRAIVNTKKEQSLTAEAREELMENTNPPSNTTPESRGVDTVLGQPLVVGSRGENVKALQRFLNYHRDYLIQTKPDSAYFPQWDTLNVDGIFGAKTKRAVIWWFAANEVTPAEWARWKVYNF